MNRRQHYNALRARGWPASDAWRAATIRARFDDLAGLVKLDTVEDDLPYEWGDIEPTKADLERLRNDGVWILVSYWRPTEDDEWISVDSCGGFIGEDWRNSGYDDDIRRVAIDAYEDDLQDQAKALAGRATYATGP